MNNIWKSKKVNYDKEKIGIMLNDLKVYFRGLEDMKINSIKDVDEVKFYAASMLIFSIINRAMDLANELVMTGNLGFPMQYKELFDFLEGRVIDKKTKEELKDLVILRNKISHRYGVIEKKDIVEAVKKIQIVKKFMDNVVKEVK